MPYCRCGNEFPEARAQLGFDSCLECGTAEAAAEIARRSHMIAPISHKSGYTYLGPDRGAQRQRLLEGSAKTPPMETAAPRIAPGIGRAARPKPSKRRRYEFAGWEFKPDKRGVRQKRAILREIPSD
ncbi:MAG: hypothetical protein JO095_07505 [Alphaproteobacteria bacterium]|nr:hypothetical protein [Alphaproteobacteria bacterium]MBV9200862.1 hypothetical protein [Alphaproteobacteria bacterium]